MKLLEAENLAVRYGAFEALRGVSFSLDAGDWLMVVGPNGAGKSTLLGAVAQSVPSVGILRCCGDDLRTLRPRERARRIGMLAQSNAVGYSFTVAEVVRLGRYAYAPGAFSKRSGDDEAQIARALAAVGLEGFAERSVLSLSGGELQRVFLAQVLAQDPTVLLLDEPGNHLDLKYQKELFALLGGWLAQGNRAVVSVVHDLSLARACGTDALLLKSGEPLAYGPIRETLSDDALRRAYDMDVSAWMRSLLGQWEDAH